MPSPKRPRRLGRQTNLWRALVLDARSGVLGAARCRADRLHLPAGEGGRHQHDAHPRPTRNASSSTSSSTASASATSIAATRWSSGSRRSHQVLHQARDRNAGRHGGNGRAAQVIVNGQRAGRRLTCRRGLSRPASPCRRARAFPSRRVLRAGRSSQLVQRQPHLGHGAARRTFTAKPFSFTGR